MENKDSTIRLMRESRGSTAYAGPRAGWPRSYFKVFSLILVFLLNFWQPRAHGQCALFDYCREGHHYGVSRHGGANLPIRKDVGVMQDTGGGALERKKRNSQGGSTEAAEYYDYKYPPSRWVPMGKNIYSACLNR